MKGRKIVLMININKTKTSLALASSAKQMADICIATHNISSNSE